MKKDRILCIYCICGISKDNTDVYPHYLQKIVDQDFDGEMKIVISACQPRERTIPHLKSLFPQCSYHIINDKIPVNCSFNSTVIESIKRYGEFDGYCYITCDSIMQTPYDIQNLFDILKSDERNGMISAKADVDNCFSYGILRNGINHPQYDKIAEEMMFKNQDFYKMKPGDACAAHCNLWSNKIQQYYGQCIPSCFSGYCSESTFQTICAALKLNWIIADILVKHTPSLDSPSGGFRPEDPSRNTIPTYYQGFIDKDLSPIFGEEYKKLGGTLETCQNIMPPDLSQYDENGWIKNEDLKVYIKENLYLSKEKFDYDKINSEWYE